MADNEKGAAALDGLLASISKCEKPALWIYIRDRYDKIEIAHDNHAMTYREMAVRYGVSEAAWHRAMARARRWIAKHGSAGGSVKSGTVTAAKAKQQEQEQERDDLPPLPGMRQSKSKDNLPFQS